MPFAIGQRTGKLPKLRRLTVYGFAGALLFPASVCANDSKPGNWDLRAAATVPEHPQLPAIAAAPVVISALSAEKSGARTRISFRLAGSAAPRIYVLANPERAIIDLPEVRFDLPAGAGRLQSATRLRGTAIKGYRFGLLEAGKSRIVFDLAGPVRIVSSGVESVGGSQQFTAILEAVSREAFLADARAAAESMRQTRDPAGARTGAAPQAGKPVVVLDPGHGGIDTGARGQSQAWEKDVVLAFARVLAEKLEETGRYRTIFTRSEDVFVSLPERVRIARDAGAQLFISVHADTLNEKWVEGATVYTVSDKASDAHAARLAEKENQADKLAGAESGEDGGEVSDILYDLTRKETRTFSHFFARSLVSYWKDAGKLNKNPLRSAGFHVLKAPDVPSVLLELGYLSSKTEAALMAQPEWRANAASAVVRSVEAFFGANSPAQAEKAAAAGQAGDGAPENRVSLPDAGVAAAIR